MIIKFKKTHPKAKIPAYALPGDAGMDLFSVEDKVIKTNKIEEIHTGINIELPKNTVGLVWDKGSTARRGLKTMGGVFDENYRGELIILATNVKKEDYVVETGDKIAQLLVQKIEHPSVKVVEKLSETNRGKGRLGSTGKR